MVYALLLSSLLAISLLAVPMLLGDFVAYQLGLYLIYGMTAQGVGFLWGKAGVLPLGQALFFGVSAYSTGIIFQNVDSLSLHLVFAILTLAILGVVAYVIAAVVFKRRTNSGPYFSLITLALAMIVEQLAGTTTHITGGFNGLYGFDSIAGLDPFGSLYYLIVVCSVSVTLLLMILNTLPINLIAKAVSENEPRMQLLGFPTYALKAQAFAFSAIIAGLGGWLFASHQGIVTPTSTGFALSAELVIITAVGGRFHVFGPLIGAVVFGFLASEMRDNFVYWELLLAVVFIVVVLKAKGGLAELIIVFLDKIFPKLLSISSNEFVRTAAPPSNRVLKAGNLIFCDVHLQIGVVKILDGVSFVLPESGIVSVIGPNGAGKTTILNTITGNLFPTTGSINFEGKRIDKRPPYAALKSSIGRKLQVPSVFFSLSASDNLAVAMMAGRARVPDYFKRSTLTWYNSALTNIIDHPNVPLKTELNKTAQTLSQGHRQFLEFAMTAATEPKLLLLDEPCAGLSSEETSLMTELVREFQSQSDGLVVMVEHDMSIVEAISDKVLVLHQGRVLSFGSFLEIKNNTEVQAVYAGGTK